MIILQYRKEKKNFSNYWVPKQSLLDTSYTTCLAHIVFPKLLLMQNVSLIQSLILVFTSAPKKRSQENVHTKFVFF